MEINIRSVKHKAKVLLTEDDPIVCKVHCMMLEKMGYIVDIAINGKKALLLFNDNTYEVILMDLGLPDISGIKIATEIRHRENNKKYTPIIAVTAFIKSELEEECQRAGIDKVVAKPISMNDLKKTIQEAIKA